MTFNPFSDPDGTREEILAATAGALSKHGYAELTIKRIGDEFDKSQSLIYHHYDSKDELVLDCLEFAIERSKEAVVGDDVDNPRTELEQFLTKEFESDSDDPHRQFRRTLIELRAQASHDEDYREIFTRSDRVFQNHIAGLIEAGIESGEFRECDPEQVAATISTVLSGVFLRQATTTEHSWREAVQTQVDSYLQTNVYAVDDAVSDGSDATSNASPSDHPDGA